MSVLKVDELQSRTSGNRITLPDVNNYPPYRNLIINGDMSIAQRGTSATGLTVGGYRTADRFLFGLATAGTWTMSQDTDVPTGQGFANSAKMDCTTANGSLSAGSFITFQQRFEGQNLQYLKKGTANAESVTLSFWIKSNKTGTCIAELSDRDNTRQISKSFTINAADTWEKKTITYEGDTTGTLDNDNDSSLWLLLWLTAGTDYTSGTLNTSWASSVNANRVVGANINFADSTSNYINITGVQLEVGDSATPFEHIPYDVNLQRCMRYYFNHYTPDDNGLYGLFTAHTSSAGRMPYRFIVPMRDAPTVSSSTASGFTWLGNNTAGNPSAIGSESLNKYSCTVNITGSFTQGYSYWLAGSTSTQLRFDAEL